MHRYMLDTNVCINVIKSRPPHVGERFTAEATGLCISTVTLGELLYGAEKSARRAENRSTVERFIARLDVLPFDDDASDHFAEIRASLEQKGTPIGSYDLMIAGHARSRGLTLVTNNTREFNRVEGLRIEDWLTDIH